MASAYLCKYGVSKLAVSKVTLIIGDWQVIEWHFWLKKNEIVAQVEDWISDLETYSTDKRVGRSIAHSCTSLKVWHPPPISFMFLIRTFH